VDPNFFKNKSYILNEKSDIYSLGVLFWELTSCSSPFNFKTTNDRHIIFEIIDGKREEPVPNTNDKFVELYQSKYKIPL
jgi:serine/threonine protein kinase